MTDNKAQIIPRRDKRIYHAVAPATSLRGMGLIEVMISAVIICIAMIGVGRLHNTQVQIAHHQERRLAAMALLDDKLADIRLVAHTGLVENNGMQEPSMAMSERAVLMSHGVTDHNTGNKGIDPGRDSRSAVIGNDRGGVLSAGEIRYDQYTFQLHWVVAPLPGSVVKLLTVTVSWRDGQGKLQSVSGSTVIFVS